MKLRGYETRMLLRRYGIPIPEDWILDSTEETPVMTPQQEFHIAVALNHTLGSPVLMTLYAENEALTSLRSRNYPLVYETINPIMGLHAYQAHRHASELNIPREIWQAFVDVAQRLYRCYEASDAELLAIDPLIMTTDHRLLAMNGYAVIDNNALFRQPDIVSMGHVEYPTMTEKLAHEAGLACLMLDGQIGCIVNGIGLGMTLVDLLQQYGTNDQIMAAHLIDIEGNATYQDIAQAIEISLEDTQVHTLLINIFGGLTRCDEVARGILQVFAQSTPRVPVIVRLEGTNAQEARQMIEAAEHPNLRTVATLAGAARLAITSVKGF